MVHSMRTGKLFVINLSSMKPNFKEDYNGKDDLFPSNKVFDIKAWKDEATHMKIVRDEENVNIMGD